MLHNKYRFHGHGSLRYLYNKGRVERSRALAIRFAANPRRQDSRVAVIVTRKVLKSSPKRNRIRRRLYELLRTNWHRVKPAHDIMITVYDPSFCDIPHQELQATVFDVLARAGLLAKDNDPS
jgi:ribonuclease P protein component